MLLTADDHLQEQTLKSVLHAKVCPCCASQIWFAVQYAFLRAATFLQLFHFISGVVFFYYTGVLIYQAVSNDFCVSKILAQHWQQPFLDRVLCDIFLL